MRTLAFLVVTTAAGALAGGCGGRSELFFGDGGVGESSGNAGNSGSSGSSFTGGSGGTGGGGSTGGFGGSTGTGGFGGSTGGFTGGSGTGFTGGTGVTSGSGFTGVTGITGTGYTGAAVGGSYSGISGDGVTTGSASGGNGAVCPTPVPSGITCLDGGIPGVTQAVDTGTQCFTSYGCEAEDTASQCGGTPPMADCEACANGVVECSHYAEYNGVCVNETCPPPAGSTCNSGAICVAGTACANADSTTGCTMTCECESGRLACAQVCPPPGSCETGASCSPVAPDCIATLDQPGMCLGGQSFIECFCGSNQRYGQCFTSCQFYDDGGTYFDATVPPDAPDDAEPDAPPTSIEDAGADSSETSGDF